LAHLYLRIHPQMKKDLDQQLSFQQIDEDAKCASSKPRVAKAQVFLLYRDKTAMTGSSMLAVEACTWCIRENYVHLPNSIKTRLTTTEMLAQPKSPKMQMKCKRSGENGLRRAPNYRNAKKMMQVMVALKAIFEIQVEHLWW